MLEHWAALPLLSAHHEQLGLPFSFPPVLVSWLGLRQSNLLGFARKQSKYYGVTAYGRRRILALPNISPSLNQGIGQGGDRGQLRSRKDGVPSFLF